MDRGDILKKLLSHSIKQLCAVNEEKWERCEALLNTKMDLYKKLNQAGSAFDDDEENILFEIKNLEKQAVDVLDRKKNDTGLELRKVELARKALKNYRLASGIESGRHFGITC